MQWHSALCLCFIRSRWCNFLSSSESGQDKVLDKNQLAGHLAEGCEEKGKRSKPRCSHRPQLHSHGLTAPTFANEVGCSQEFPESIGSVPTWWIFQTAFSKAAPRTRCWTLMFLSLTPGYLIQDACLVRPGGCVQGMASVSLTAICSWEPFCLKFLSAFGICAA